ncbi:uncharacterized protein LOC126879795 [Diabrotica virgifera virgifera]|uniref:Uncharacterized protein n=1 Tax=Diabrotica virgifera virgifera TaxID=50390 RepID=A0ABM5JM57_DIAVI|nr:uncharacterized protein LOC126879795 [Diabrotica virgifera virgifera]
MSTLRNNIYLVGVMKNQICGSKLPCKRDVLSVLFYNMRVVNLNLNDSSALVIDEVVVFWKKARIPVQNRSNCILKLKSLYDNVRNLEKSKNRDTERQREKENDFKEALDNLFDIATLNALNEIKIAEDREFLIKQREKGRVGCMLGVDIKLLRKEKRKEERTAAELKRKEDLLENSSCSIGHFEMEDKEHEDSQKKVINQDNSEDDIYFISESQQGPSSNKRGRKTLMTPRLAAALDKCKVSDRDTMHIISAVLEALNIDITEFVLNRSSIKRNREILRKIKYSSIKSVGNDANFIEVHWDSKLLPDITKNEKIDRLPVIAVGLDFEQLLGVPGIASSAGSEVCSAVFHITDEWNLTEKIQAFCFDTTASNTGRIKGAAVLLQQRLGRDILWLPCRHHIFEVVLAGVFTRTKAIVTSGPEIAQFKALKENWKNIDKMKFLDYTSDEAVYNALKDVAPEIIYFVKQKLAEEQPRDDYKEFLQLTLIFLGDKTNVSFRAPGAYHLARWMAKAIYCLKLFLFRDQMKMRKDNSKLNAEICVFVVYCYVEAWFSATNTTGAPLNDIYFLRKLVIFKNINENIATIAITKFLNHLWYLSEECAAMAIFDDRIERVEKIRMAQKIMECASKNIETVNEKEEENEETEVIEKKLSLQIRDVQNFVQKDLPTELLSANSLQLFKRFGICVEFLQDDPLNWENREDYRTGKNIISTLKCTNDIAERGVKLIEDYNEKMTKNEHQKQFLIQVVQEYRREFPVATKGGLLKSKICI